MYVKKAKISKIKIKDELYFVLEKPAKYSAVLKHAEENGGKIFGKEIAPSNAVAYLRILKQVGGKSFETFYKIFINEHEFLRGNMSYWVVAVARARNFPAVEIRVKTSRLELSDEVVKEMKRYIGGITTHQRRTSQRRAQ